MQLLIPFAFVDSPGCVQALAGLQLPHLDRLLRTLSLVDSDAGSPDTLSPPHERALARALGISADDGKIPWAALNMARNGRTPVPTGCAWVSPAHWQIGSNGIQMLDPDQLQLQETESRSLLQAMAGFFAQDGLHLEFDTPARWLAMGDPLTDLASASLDRVIGSDVSPWMPATPALRRLQNEMQMLLYTHPVNDARAERGLLPVNSFWISGSGACKQGLATRKAPQLADGLSRRALLGDWAGWAEAWRSIDQQSCQPLLSACDAGDRVTLTLCSDRNALQFSSSANRWRDRLQRRFKRVSLKDYCDQL